MLPSEEWAHWEARYQTAAAALENRDAGVGALAEQLEQGMALLGVTAIEDKLQVGGVHGRVRCGIRV